MVQDGPAVGHTSFITAPAKNSQASLTQKVPLVPQLNPDKTEESRPLPKTAGEWCGLNKQLFLGAKVALKPPYNASERELKGWKDFQNWLRFHNPPFNASDIAPWLDGLKPGKTPRNGV